jgi:hypothetical protein
MTIIECPWCDGPAHLGEPDAARLDCEVCGLGVAVAPDPISRSEEIAAAA